MTDQIHYVNKTGREASKSQEHGSKVVVFTPHRASRANQHERASWVRRFVAGSKPVTIAKTAKVSTEEVYEEIRAAIPRTARPPDGFRWSKAA